MFEETGCVPDADRQAWANGRVLTPAVCTQPRPKPAQPESSFRAHLFGGTIGGGITKKTTDPAVTLYWQNDFCP
jgi:hypothetical protein